MKPPRHNRFLVLHFAFTNCSACAAAADSSVPMWSALTERMKQLIKADKAEAELLDVFAKKFGGKLDNAAHMAQYLNGDWIGLLRKVLGSVVSIETKLKRLNCAKCDPADFPVILAVIQAMAWGAPSEMWYPEVATQLEVGQSPSDIPDYSTGPPPDHREIAQRTWYRPELAMLVTSIWPRQLGLTYYESTLSHILYPHGSIGDDFNHLDILGLSL